MEIFEGITEFLAVGDALGFTAAAKRLGVSPSHVSRQVAALEKRIGVRLVARSTRRVKLTQAGLEYHRRCSEIAYGLDEATRLAVGETYQLEGRLRISAAGAFAERHIAPAMIEFAKYHPYLTVEMDFDSRFVNFIDDGFDFAIRYGKLSDSGMVARKLTERELIAAASPDYLEKYGTPTHPQQLHDHVCIVANSDRWVFWDQGKPTEVKVSGRWQSNNASAICEACAQGLGIAYMPHTSFGDYLQQRRLTAILKEYSAHRVETWLVYPDRRFLPLRARRAIEFLLERFKSPHIPIGSKN